MNKILVASCRECQHRKENDYPYCDHPKLKNLVIGDREINQYTKFVGKFPLMCPLYEWNVRR